MTFEQFKASLSDARPPKESDKLLQALWHDAKGDWHAAHEIAQDVDTAEGAWVHVYLHRKEGDQSNASYWYHRAKKNKPTGSWEEEWEAVVKELIVNLKI